MGWWPGRRGRWTRTVQEVLHGPETSQQSRPQLCSHLRDGSRNSHHLRPRELRGAPTGPHVQPHLVVAWPGLLHRAGQLRGTEESHRQETQGLLGRKGDKILIFSSSTLSHTC